MPEPLRVCYLILEKTVEANEEEETQYASVWMETEKGVWYYKGKVHLKPPS